MWAGVAVLVAGIAVADLLLWRLVIMPRVHGRAADAAREATIALGGDPIVSGTVRYLGVESDGRRQVRGTGHLAVGRDEVVFVLAAPRRTVRIPRARITAVDMTSRHLGRSVGRPLLRIHFTAQDGRQDAVAFDVGRSPTAWQEALGTA